MTEGQQAIEGILRIEKVVGPMAMKSTGGIPKSINKIEATFMYDQKDAAIHCGESVQRRRCREQVGQGRRGCGFESALRMGLRQEPVANARVDRKTKVTNQRDGAGRSIEGTHLHAWLVAPGAIGAFEVFKAAHKFQEPRGRFPKVLPGA